MGCDGTMRDRVGEGIERLEERYGSFPVNQMTLSVCESDYETARDRADAGKIDVYARVSNDGGDVLHLSDEEEYPVPRCVNGPEEPLGITVARTVREETGVACTVERIARVTIAGVDNEADPAAPTVYRLIVLLDAAYDGGRAENGVWKADAPAIPEYV